MIVHYYLRHKLVAAGSAFAAAIVLAAGCRSEPRSASVPEQPKQVSAAPEPTREPSTASMPAKETQTGSALLISGRFQGKPTASGVPYDQNRMVAAHASYPLGTVVRVVNLDNRQTADVRIIDRSAAKRAGSDIIDLSYAAAERLGFAQGGRVPVRIEVIEWGEERR